jgi:hypothetical protein
LAGAGAFPPLHAAKAQAAATSKSFVFMMLDPQKDFDSSPEKLD